MSLHSDTRLLISAWLSMLLLGSLFFVGYPLTNQLAANNGHAMLLSTPLDQYVPFWSWTLIPYMSLNLLYPCSFYLHTNSHALRRFSAQLFVAQMSCLLIFWLYPTMNTRPIPQADGLPGLLLAQLKQFDQPYNMLPSLHIAVLVVLWQHPVRLQLNRFWRSVWHVWAGLIVLASLTTWQHYLLDVLAGFAIGLLCLLALPYRAAATMANGAHV